MKISLKSTVTFVLALILPVIFIPTIVIFGCYRRIITIILKIKHKSQFVGLVEGGDVVWTFDDVSKSILNIILVLKSNTTTEEFIEKVRNTMSSCLKKYTKFSYLRRKSFGYNYFLRSDYNLVEDCIKTVRVEGTLDKNYLENFLSTYSSRDMPKSDAALWEVITFDRAASWAEEPNRFIIMFRIHHCLGDGLSLVHFFISQLSDSVDSSLSYEKDVKKWRRNVPMKDRLFYFWTVLRGSARFILQLLLKPSDRNILHDRALSGKKIYTWAKEGEELLPIIKKIKSKSEDCRFSDVLLTGVSASFREFYFKKNQPLPKFLTTITPSPINSSDRNFFDLKNQYSVTILTLPISRDGDNVATLEEIKAQTKALRNSPDTLVNFFVLSVIAPLIPEPLVRPAINLAEGTLGVSIVPGTANKLSVLQGQTLEDAVFWIPHHGATGVGLSFLTYDNRIQIGLSVDKALPLNRKDMEEIVGNVPKYILEVYRDLCGSAATLERKKK